MTGLSDNENEGEPVYPVELLVPLSLFRRIEEWAAEFDRSPEDEMLWILDDYSPAEG